MSENNGTAAKSRAERIAQLGRELAAQIAELEALAAWVVGQQERQTRLEVLAAEAEEDRQERDKGVVWLG